MNDAEANDADYLLTNRQTPAESGGHEFNDPDEREYKNVGMGDRTVSGPLIISISLRMLQMIKSSRHESLRSLL